MRQKPTPANQKSFTIELDVVGDADEQSKISKQDTRIRS